MPELKDPPRDDWEDADVDVSFLPVYPVRMLNLPPPTAGYVWIF